MNSLLAVLLLALAPAGADADTLQTCAKTVGATATADRLAALPPPVRDELIRMIGAMGGALADSGTPLLETDAPTMAERHLAHERFEQAVLVHDTWFVQIKQSLFANVLTLGFARQSDGTFAFSPAIAFRGPACASIEAALAGVMIARGF